MTLRSSLAAVLPFVHLAGIARPGAAEGGPAAEGEDTAAAEGAPEDTAAGEDTAAAEGAGAGEDTVAGAEAPAAEEEEEDGAPEMRARAAERARIHAILTDATAAASPGLAAHLAFETDHPAEAACRMMAAAASSPPGGAPGAAARPGLAQRMAAAPIPVVGAPPAAPEPQGRAAEAASLAAQCIAAAAKARGGK